MRTQRVLCLVPTCQEHLDTRVPVVRSTWAANLLAAGMELFFVIGDPHISTPSVRDDILYVPCKDGFSSLALKMFLALQWSLGRQYDYVAKFDDDTYVFPEFTRMQFTGDYIGRLTLSAIFERDGKPFSMQSFLRSDRKNFVQESRARSFLHQDWSHLLDYHQGGAGYVLRRDVVQQMCLPDLNVELSRLWPLLPRFCSRGGLLELLGMLAARFGRLSVYEFAGILQSEDNFIGFMMRHVDAQWVSSRCFCDYVVHYCVDLQYEGKAFDHQSCLATLHPFKEPRHLAAFHDHVLAVYGNNLEKTPERQAIRMFQYFESMMDEIRRKKVASWSPAWRSCQADGQGARG